MENIQRLGVELLSFLNTQAELLWIRGRFAASSQNTKWQPTINRLFKALTLSTRLKLGLLLGHAVTEKCNKSS
jgi:hypothetical protein